jgi:hypothetical protein
MTKWTKILLGISLTAFAIACTGMLWGLALPLGAVFFGLFLIAKVLEKETALFDEEQRAHLGLARENNAPASRQEQGATKAVSGGSQRHAGAHS